MGVLDRISQILRANVNDLVDNAEDPEKILNQLIRDMEDALQKGQSQVAEQIAQEKMIQRDLDDAKAKTGEWGKKAEFAVTKGADDLAREALHRQNDYNDQVAIYQQQLDVQHQAVQKLKGDLEALQNKYEDARRNKDMLIARAKRAEAQKQIGQASVKVSSVDYSGELGRMERRIQEKEARVAADQEVHTDSTDDKFRKLGENDQVDQQLAEMKKKLGK